MAKITVDIEAIEYLLKSINSKDRNLLFQHLKEEDIWKEELDKVVNKLRKTIQRKGITDEEIDKICEEVRKENYEKRKHRC